MFLRQQKHAADCQPHTELRSGSVCGFLATYKKVTDNFKKGLKCTD